MANRPPTSTKQHGHMAGRPKSNGPPLSVATVKYGNNQEIILNLDCRLVDLHLVISELIGGGQADLISDKGQVVDLQGMLADGSAKDADCEDIRAGVLKSRATYYILQVLHPNMDVMIAAGKKHVKGGSKKGPPPLPDDLTLWKMLFQVSHERLTNDQVLKHSNGSPIPLQLPSGLKERVQARMAAHIEANPVEPASRSNSIRQNKSRGNKH
mmetsp:Transcript_34188/g.89715  ORF Transcript_34188/g.89715 Transcript_34188/m.89715 type:complete len:212 (-) Transcript_34188:51-686(-)|eukprot:CAMPEP_0182917588 /NCGR_PEP_ID=MMETSP0105_2-20130417/1607_1 /TAXON_ID=81532 ORGANISM="Acanthoeca-like sp., Strain 10tr" /NCGR_SAMPLE_ID=MMETSP0105_2 /ASSEMBLY_ACC=CAM_ASM_000205 /LENGTH=211 /DNA_ID=CAMNT_0025054603 /DNA_START=406 /DNA_END=1041 /DNA_ORIENTATION=+